MDIGMGVNTAGDFLHQGWHDRERSFVFGQQDRESRKRNGQDSQESCANRLL
jgi:hypothetical protein